MRKGLIGFSLDEESLNSSPSNTQRIPIPEGIQDLPDGRAVSANPSSVGRESGFLSSDSVISLTPSIMAGSLYEYPIMQSVEGTQYLQCKMILPIISPQVSSLKLVTPHLTAWLPLYHKKVVSRCQEAMIEEAP